MCGCRFLPVFSWGFFTRAWVTTSRHGRTGWLLKRNSYDVDATFLLFQDVDVAFTPYKLALGPGSVVKGQGWVPSVTVVVVV